MAISEVNGLTREQFHNEILPAGNPVVIRGLVDHWPLVKAAKEGDTAFCRYLLSFDTEQPIHTVQGPASIEGRIFYNQDISGLNCRVSQIRLANALEYILEHARDEPTPTIAIQSILVSQYLSGLERDNPLPLLSEDVAPRIWLGSKAIVAAHYDPMENIACCVAGRRRFTLFPPEQVFNLYTGPFELTPAGATISMVDFDNPDYEKYPRFREAEKAAVVADLEPGDALYIPYLWWHHVRALDDLNVLVNYWWGQPDPKYVDPRNAMFSAMLAIKSLPPHYQKAWQAHFNHYVFGEMGDPAEHLPVDRRGILDELDDAALRKIKQSLMKALSR